MKIYLKLSIACLIYLSASQLFGQCDSTAYYAKSFLGDTYISDGQSYRALIYDNQVAEFNTTFYGGAEYRIAAMAGSEKGQIQFSLYDQENNLLFTNVDYANSPYWNLEFDSTIECKIEAKLDPAKQNSGCVVLLIGFER